MGREIRKVPLGWEHPRYTSENAPRPDHIGAFIPMYDEDYDTAAQEWLRGLMEWEADTNGVRTEASSSQYFTRYYWDWHGGPPDKHHYRAERWTPEDATHFQLYENVSEGTPITPAFATTQALVEHLVAHGTAWDKGGWPRDAAERMVREGYAPSLIVRSDPSGVTISSPRDMTDDALGTGS